MEIGLYTFGDLPLGTRGPAASSQRLSEIIEAAKLADQAGLSVFGIGEHHRLDYTISVPVAVMGAIAAVTKSIRITTAVTILSSSDPVRIFEELATIDLLSAGRGELTVGRGAFIESFPLFGYDLGDYDALYDEKLALLLKIAASDEVTWRGRFRPALDKAEIAPRPYVDRPPIWVGAGGTPESAVRAGKAGVPLNLANIGGEPARFRPFIDLYRRSFRDAGHDPAGIKVGISRKTASVHAMNSIPITQAISVIICQTATTGGKSRARTTSALPVPKVPSSSVVRRRSLIRFSMNTRCSATIVLWHRSI
ncbi:LLM class flavin-dependent oxidoreductase [Rhizobium rhizogenes]|uniref:LLM class flavin-dependent oxidoreductase n=1 Tax=Rhizobium rhizogenes TaxID=359 RepID=UPI000A84C1FF|nr:LLM class flavin-dependent oxidoreductase [Rhizobium rhizogenes]